MRLSPQSDLLLSALYGAIENNRLFKEVILIPGLPDFFTIDEFLQDHTGYQLDAQYLFRMERLNLAVGGSVYHTDIEQRHRFTQPGEVSESDPFSLSREQHAAYLYSHIEWPKDLFWTLGGSYDSYKESDINVSDAFHPKIGVQWNVTDRLHVRMAYAETLRPTVLVEQTLEPTEIAGFNQFFDDPPGTEARRYGIGIDARLSARFYGGLEASRRDINVPRVSFNAGAELQEKLSKEDVYRAYLYWTPAYAWAVSAEYRLEQFGLEKPVTPTPPNRVVMRDTATVPFSIRYFHPAGLFAGFGATFVHQEVERFSSESLNSDFVTVDMAIGYRLPKRLGIVSVGVNNLLDEKFRFQDDNFRTSGPIPATGNEPGIEQATFSAFTPDRTIFAGVTLSF